MKHYRWLIGLLLLGATLGPFSSQAQTNCKRGNPGFTGYMERDNDKRCEGVNAFQKSGGLELVSLATGKLQPSNGQLMVQVPKVANLSAPIVIVRSYEQYYQLRPLTFRTDGSRLEFRWPTRDVIEREKIAYSSLRATAESKAGNRLVYLPVIFNQSAGQTYSFVLSSERPFTMKSFEIRERSGKVIHRKSVRNFDPGEVVLTWNGRRDADGQFANKGRYRLVVKAELQQPSEEAPPINISFEHDPQWLK